MPGWDFHKFYYSLHYLHIDEFKTIKLIANSIVWNWIGSVRKGVIINPWHDDIHDMETVSALLAFCDGIHQWLVDWIPLTQGH